jgi:hypothetical protein
MTDLTGQIGICLHGTTTIAKLIEWADESPCHHVVVAKDNDTCVSAEPGGVVERTNAAYGNIHWFDWPLTGVQKAAVVAACNASLRLPYNYAIYAPLLLSRLTGVPVPAFLANWLGKRRNVDCSQLADDIYKAAGIQLFTESSDIVTPGDFYRLAVTNHFL